jgi:hypothetical protein
MAMKNVTSREYKVMLRPARFTGREPRLLRAADALWRDFSASVSDIAVDTKGRLDTIDVRRAITFYDTRERLLNNSRYIFRDRRDTTSQSRDVTLKFRHADRYVAQARQMDAVASARGRTKFEEDIKGPFLSLYSFSTRVAMKDDTSFKSLDDVRRLFPGVVDQIDGFRGNAKLSAVGRFTARELVLTGAHLQVGKTPKVEAECALIVWYDERGAADKPVAVELSYRYGDEDERYGGGSTRRAFEIFSALQTLTRWVDPRPRTKTAFVYQ